MSTDTDTIAVDWLLADPGVTPQQHGAQLYIAQERFAEVISTNATATGLIALPGLANAHDHGRAINATPFGGFDKPLETWLAYLGIIPGLDAHRAAACAFGNAARRGVGRVMVHYTRLQGLTDPVTEAVEVARAARDVGTHIGFAVALRDRHPITYADNAHSLAHLPAELRASVQARLDRAPLSADAQLALVDDIITACDAPGFNVQYGPTGVQWCTPALLQAIAQASADNHKQVHMHLLETRYQREWADHNFPDGIVRYLHDIGLLSPRLTLAHCTYCRPDELLLIAQSGATIAVNTSSNLGLRSGIAPVATMLATGCRIAMGIDGQALDEDDDALRELRLLYQLHKGWGYDTAMSHAQAWQIASRHGRWSISGVHSSGTITQGEIADLILLDGAALMTDRMFDDIPVLDFVLARAKANHIRRVIVAGKTIVADGVVLGIDHPLLMREMLQECRDKLHQNREWRHTVQAMHQAFKPFYSGRHHLGCC